jgi:hypothetical protein
METIITTSAKFNGDMAVMYPVFWNNQLINRTFSQIRDFIIDDYYKASDMVIYEKKVYKCLAKTYITGIYPNDSQLWELTSINEQGFKISAQKRFRQSLENFANIFISANKLDKNVLKYDTEKNKITHRKPTFCTLTLPVKVTAEDDYKIKKIFDTWLKNIVQNKGVKLYVWRAEAQLNGNIHFHIVFDRFLDQKQLKKSWYRQLHENGLTNKKLSYEEHSRICWIQELPRPELIKHELAGYFATDEDEDGNILYKHKKLDEDGNPVYVRKIHGRSWGDSDKLHYQPFTIENISQEVTNLITSNFLFNKLIKDKNDNTVGELYIFKQIVHKKNKKPYVLEKAMHAWLEHKLNIYHLAFATKIYKRQAIPEYLFNYTFNNPYMEVKHIFKKDHLPNYDIYKNFIIK